MCLCEHDRVMFACVSPQKAAWAPGTGVKESNFKANWDVDMGVTYVPWDDLPTVNIDALAVGGMVDGDSLPEHTKSESCNRIHTYKYLMYLFVLL